MSGRTRLARQDENIEAVAVCSEVTEPPKKQTKPRTIKKKTETETKTEAKTETKVEPIIQSEAEHKPLVQPEPPVNKKTYILSCNRLNHKEKIEFILESFELLKLKGLIPNNIHLEKQILESTELPELQPIRNSKLKIVENYPKLIGQEEEEMEEVVITTIKYEYNGKPYLKDEDGNLYTLEEPHDFVLNIYDNELLDENK